MSSIKKESISKIKIWIALAFVTGTIWTAGETIADAQDAYVWKNSDLGAGLTQNPNGWKTDRSTELSVRWVKDFEGSGLKLTEVMTFQISSDTSSSLREAIDTLRQENYALVEELRLGKNLTAPFWLMSRPVENPDESSWLAFSLHGGKVFSLAVQFTQLDKSAKNEFMQVLNGFRFIMDPRETAWNAFLGGEMDAARDSFKRILRTNPEDANARYGLGLTELATDNIGAALKNLEMAEPSLKGKEDVRRALGRAEYEQGHIARAVALWIQVILDDPGSLDGLRPWILKGIQTAAQNPEKMRSSRQAAELANRMIQAGEVFGNELDEGDPLRLNELRIDFGRMQEKLMEFCLEDTGTSRELDILYASLKMDEGIRKGMFGVDSGDEDELYEAGYTISGVIRKFAIK